MALIESTAIPLAPPKLGQGTYMPSHSNHSGSPGSGGGGGGTSGSSGGGGGGSGYHIQTYDPVAMDVARVTVDGQGMQEFALANFDSSEVVIRLGFNNSPVELGRRKGSTTRTPSSSPTSTTTASPT